MKRWVGISAGIAALGLLGYLGNMLFVHAQVAGGTGGTRVATVNLYVVMKGYKKAEHYKSELKKLDEPFVEELKKLKQSYDDWVKFSQNPNIKQDQKDQAQKTLVDLKRMYEDKKQEQEKVIMKRAEEQMVQIYQEIEQSIQKYAASNGIHLVLHYMEPIGQEHAAMNIDRKLNRCGSMGGCYPLFRAPGVEISNEVLNTLNNSTGGGH